MRGSRPSIQQTRTKQDTFCHAPTRVSAGLESNQPGDIAISAFGFCCAYPCHYVNEDGLYTRFSTTL